MWTLDLMLWGGVGGGIEYAEYTCAGRSFDVLSPFKIRLPHRIYQCKWSRGSNLNQLLYFLMLNHIYNLNTFQEFDPFR